MNITDIIEKLITPHQSLCDYDYSKDEKELEDYADIINFCIDKLSGKYQYGVSYCQEGSGGYKLAQKAKQILEETQLGISQILEKEEEFESK